MGLSVLIVENVEAYARRVVDAVEGLGWRACWKSTFAEAFAEALRGEFNIVVLDRLLEDGSGDALALIDAMRKREVEPAVIVFSALGTNDDQVQGLEAGAQYYLPKSADFALLTSTLRTVGRQFGFMGGASSIIQVGALEVRTKFQNATWRGELLTLTGKSYRILKVLAENPGEIVERERIWSSAWDYQSLEYQVAPLEQAMSVLRRELRKHDAEDILETVRNRGYRLRA